MESGFIRRFSSIANDNNKNCYVCKFKKVRFIDLLENSKIYSIMAEMLNIWRDWLNFDLQKRLSVKVSMD